MVFREDIDKMLESKGRTKFLDLADKHINAPENADLVQNAKQRQKENNEKNAELKKRRKRYSIPLSDIPEK